MCCDTPKTIIRSILLFVVAAIAEIGGAWLIWQSLVLATVGSRAIVAAWTDAATAGTDADHHDRRVLRHGRVENVAGHEGVSWTSVVSGR